MAYDKKMLSIMSSIQNENIPKEIKQSVKHIYEHYKKFVEVKDLDECVA